MPARYFLLLILFAAAGSGQILKPILFGPASSSSSPTVPSSGLVAAWELGESGSVQTITGAFSTTLDLTVGNDTGSGSDDPTYVSTTSGWLFDGTDDYMKRANDSSMNTSTITVVVLCKPTGGAGSYRTPLSYRETFPGNIGWTMYAADDDTWQFWGSNSGSWVHATGSSVTLNTWVLLTGRIAGGNIDLSVNKTNGTGTSITYSPNTSQVLKVGILSEVNLFMWPGNVGFIALYNRSISAGEESDIYDYLKSTKGYALP